MGCPRMESDGMRYIDGEMSESERAAFERHLDGCAECRESLRGFSEVDDLTRRIKMKDPEDAFWDEYWKSLYRRLERKTGWVLLCIGIVMLLAITVWQAVQSLRHLTWEKVAVFCIVLGGLILLVSVLRERLHQYRVDRYRDIQR